MIISLSLYDDFYDLLQHALYERMSKSESCGSECIDNSGINLGVVSGAVTLGQGQDVELLHKVNTEDNGQKLIVSYVLKQNNEV